VSRGLRLGSLDPYIACPRRGTRSAGVHGEPPALHPVAHRAFRWVAGRVQPSAVDRSRRPGVVALVLAHALCVRRDIGSRRTRRAASLPDANRRPFALASPRQAAAIHGRDASLHTIVAAADWKRLVYARFGAVIDRSIRHATGMDPSRSAVRSREARTVALEPVRGASRGRSADALLE